MENKNHIITLQDLMVYEAKKISDAENQLWKMLPQWINQVNSVKLKEILKKYSDNVNSQVEKLKNFFLNENILPVTDMNETMKAFIKETEGKLAGCTSVEVKDACLLASIQEINHYKISVYGTVTAFANLLKKEKEAQLFHETEIMEKHIDDRLSQLAEFEINPNANVPLALE